MPSLTYDQIAVGDSAETSRTISESDIYLFAGLTGDMNPAHLNEEYAKGTFFKARIAHGVLISGLISNVLGNQLPGNGTIFVSQNINFLAPVYIGDTVTARVEVSEKLEKRRIVLKTTCSKADGTVVIEGQAVVLPPKG